MSDLVERLREESLWLQQTAWKRLDGGQQCCMSSALADEAADRIEQLERELAEIRTLLKDPAAVRVNYLRGDIACHNLIDDARRQAFNEVEQKAREWAEHYPQSSDGRNTFILFAEWADDQASQCRAKAQPHSETRQEQR